jgi:hypothetical protein
MSESDSVIRRCRFNVRFARKRTRLKGAQHLIALRTLPAGQRTRPRVFEQYRQRANVVNDPARDQRRAGIWLTGWMAGRPAWRPLDLDRIDDAA